MLHCSICTDGINDSPTDTNYPWVLACGHVYHKQCIIRSINTTGTNRTCPTCRKAITSSFRLFPHVQDRDETITFLLESAQSAELQFTRQMKISEDKDNLIKKVQTTLKDNEKETNELRASYNTYVRNNNLRMEKLNTDIKKIQEENRILKENLKKTEGKVSRREATVKDLQEKLQVEKNLCKTAMAAEVKLKLEIQTLNRQMDLLKRETQHRKRTDEEETKNLRSKVQELQAEVARATEQIDAMSEREPRPRAPDPEVEGLALHLAKILQPSLPPSRKRIWKNRDDPDEEDESSVKQLRPGFGDSSRPRDGDTAKVGERPPSPPLAPPAEGGRRKFAVRKMLKVVRLNKQQEGERPPSPPLPPSAGEGAPPQPRRSTMYCLSQDQIIQSRTEAGV